MIEGFHQRWEIPDYQMSAYGYGHLISKDMDDHEEVI